MNREDFIKTFQNCYLQEDKIVAKENFKEVIFALRNDYGFNILKQIIGVDNQNSGIELIYHLYNSKNNGNIFLSQNALNNETETVTDIFKSAIADENEIYDLFGVIFKGNENLKRLYLPKNWKGYPLRKDYVQDDMRLAWNGDDEA